MTGSIESKSVEKLFDDFVSVSEAAHVIGRNPRTVRRWADEGAIVAFQQRPGAMWVVYMPSVRSRVDRK